MSLDLSHHANLVKFNHLFGRFFTEMSSQGNAVPRPRIGGWVTGGGKLCQQ